MPLPDERPRQSVANLIGRFEQQTRRPSTSSSTPRSSSVASHNTGDSAREELKEKREWTLRSTGDTSQSVGDSAKELPREKKEWPPRALAASHGLDDAVRNKEGFTIKKPSDESTASRPLLSREPSSNSNLGIPDLPEQSVEANVAGSRNGSSSQVAPAAKLPASKSAPTTSMTKLPSKNVRSPHTPGKMPPSSFTKSSSLQTIKLEIHDRNISSPTTSTTTVLKPGTVAKSSRPLSRATVRSKTPSASGPSHPKTPSSKPKIQIPPIPKTPTSASRPKTPASAIQKTPSTGLYAPTAASLARARNAQSPQPERKKSLGSSVSLDRLSKPTAASLSKARTPALTSSSSTTPAKARVSAPTRMKPRISKEAGVVGSAEDVTRVAPSEVTLAEATTEVEHTSNGHGDNLDIPSDSSISHPEIILSDAEGHEHEHVEGSAPDKEELHYMVEVHPTVGDEASPVDPRSVEQQENNKQIEEPAPEEPANASPPSSVDPISDSHHSDEEGPDTTHDKTELAMQPTDVIEEVVNLLESSSFSSKAASSELAHKEPAAETEKILKPVGTVALDVAGEIPDEE